MTIECLQCHHKNPDDAEFCENCGAQLTAPVPAGMAAAGAAPVANPPVAPAQAPDSLVCPNCKAPYTVGDVFCFNCGYDLTKLPAVPNSSVAAAPVASSQPPMPTQRAVPGNSAPAPAQQQPDLSPDAFDAMLASGAPLAASAPPAPGPRPAPAPQPAPAPVQAQPAPAEAEPNAFNVPAPAPQTAAVPQPAPAPAAAPGKLVLNISGPYGLEVMEYKGKELLLGRQDIKTRVFPDINLDDAASSRRHLSIWKEDSDGFFYAQDLESSNGTVLNNDDMPAGEAVRLNDSDIIKIGTRYSIQVRIS